MKALVHSFKGLPHSFANPFNRAALPLFFLLAFLPGVFHLTLFQVPITNPVLALGPVIAAFWVATGLRAIRVNFLLLGGLLTLVLWAVNWLMLAEPSCCAPTYH